MLRDKQVDFLRGIAIICVVMGHINPVAQVNNFIYSFHMALFMFLAGITFYYSFVAKQVNSKTFLEFQYLKKRFRQLIIPFMAWCVLLEIYHSGIDNLVNAIGNNFNKLWFFPTLYGIMLIAIVVEKNGCLRGKNRSMKCMLVELLLYIVATVVVFSVFECTEIKLLRQMAVYVIPFSIGIFIKKYEYIAGIFSDKRSSIICMILYLTLLPMYDMTDKSLSTLIIRFITGLLFIKFMYSFTSFFNFDTYMKRWLCFIGKNSMGIYILQEFFRPFFPLNIDNVLMVIVCHFIVSVIICHISIVIFKILELYKVTSKILVGK